MTLTLTEKILRSQFTYLPKLDVTTGAFDIYMDRRGVLTINVGVETIPTQNTTLDGFLRSG